MTGMGAELGADGKWQFNGKPITLIFLIRPDGDGTRKPMGDYVANQLETVGFTVDRQYKTSSEAFPIWQGTAAKDGQWNLYTAGFTPGSFPRDERANFQTSYLNTSIQGTEPFISNVSDPEFQKLGDDLAQGNFSTQEQREPDDLPRPRSFPCRIPSSSGRSTSKPIRLITTRPRSPGIWHLGMRARM